MDGRAVAWSIAAPMRAPILAFLLVAASACTQGNTELPPFYDAAAQPGSDSGGVDASEDVVTTGGDSAAEAATDGSVGDGPVEGASGDGGDGGSSESGAEGGPSDSGGGGG
jgi:hypothetical protein